MTIYITTSLPSTLTSVEQLSILTKLHKNNLQNLHISFVQNKLCIYSDDSQFEHQIMGMIDSNKAGAIENFKKTFFSGIECEITSVDRFAFLPRSGSMSFTGMIESALKEQSDAEQYTNALLVMTRLQNIYRRKVAAISSARNPSSDPYSYNYDPSRASARNPFHDLSSEDDEEHIFNSHMKRPQTGAFFQHRHNSPHPHQRARQTHAIDEVDFDDFGDFGKDRAKKELCIDYEKQLVRLYDASLLAIRTTPDEGFSAFVAEMMTISLPSSVVIKESQDAKEHGIVLTFNVKKESPFAKSLIADDDVIFLKKTLLEIIGIADRFSKIEFKRDVMGQIIGFTISHPLMVTENQTSFFLNDVRKALYAVGLESHCVLIHFATTNAPKPSAVATVQPRDAVTPSALFSKRPPSPPKLQPSPKPSGNKESNSFCGFKRGFL